MDCSKYLITAILLLFGLSTAAYAKETSKETISSGRSAYKVGLGNIVLSNGQGLLKVWKELAIEGEPPKLDYDNELVLLISGAGNSDVAFEIIRFERKPGNKLIVTYLSKDSGMSPGEEHKPGTSFLISKIGPIKTEGIEVKFVDESVKGGIPPGTGMGQIPPYEGVTQFDKEILVAEYIPLDKGNEWTYSVVSNGDSSELIQSIVAESHGWSMFDSFFGVKNLGMRIAPSGEIYLTSKSGIKTFYPAGTEKSFTKSELKIPAGTFKDNMIVTIPDKDGLYFKDVYARGVGLIYHERKSPKGTVEYKLVKARVRGMDYPRPK